MSLKEREAVIDLLCEFLEVTLHNILYIRKLYPKGIFEKRKKYGVMVYQSIHPQVNEYITESLKAVKFHCKRNQLKQLLVCIVSLEGRVVHERFVFDVLNLQNSFENDPIYIKLEQNMRDFCLKLHSSSIYLQPLPEDATFRIMLHTTDYSNLSYTDEPAFLDFPWIYIDETKCKMNEFEIIPLHTLSTDSIVLQAYVEKNSNS